MAKIGGMFFDELKEGDIEFEFDKFMDPIVEEEEKKAKLKKEQSEAAEIRKMDRYLDRAGNKVRFGRKK